MRRKPNRRDVIALTLGILGAASTPGPASAASLTAAEARAIAKAAYVYGYPLVDSYRIQYSYFVDRADPEFKGAWNEVHNTARVYTPDDKTIHSPNSDTPYSFIGADLRAEPLVLTMPAVEAGRYYSALCIDAQTFNIGYIGSRTTGNSAGYFLLAGPHWRGPTPKGVKAVIRSETELAFVFYRTQLLGPDDIENVKRIQAGYRVQPLSQFLGQGPLPAPPAINFIKPLSREQQRTSLAFFDILNFVLRFCPTHPSERTLMARFARLGIGAGKSFNANALAPEIRKAVEDGMADAWKDYGALEMQMVTGARTAADVFGARDYLQNNYLYRMYGAAAGIYGNSKEEALYPSYRADAAGRPMDGSHRYTVRFPPGELPPVNAFWSLTMYESPSRMLVANPLGRYLINSPMLPNLKRDADGGVTLYLQHASPGEDREANWLPAPSGSFVAALRLYWPKPEALDGRWKKPPLMRVERRGWTQAPPPAPASGQPGDPRHRADVA